MISLKKALSFTIKAIIICTLNACEYLEGNNSSGYLTSNVVEIDSLKNKSMNFGPLKEQLKNEFTSDLINLNILKHKLQIENRHYKNQKNETLLNKISNYKKAINSDLINLRYAFYRGNIREIIIKRKEKYANIIKSEINRYHNSFLILNTNLDLLQSTAEKTSINENRKYMFDRPGSDYRPEIIEKIKIKEQELIIARKDLSNKLAKINKMGSEGYIPAREVVRQIKSRFEKEMGRNVAMINKYLSTGNQEMETNNQRLGIISNTKQLAFQINQSRIMGVSNWYLLRKEMINNWYTVSDDVNVHYYMPVNLLILILQEEVIF